MLIAIEVLNCTNLAFRKMCSEANQSKVIEECDQPTKSTSLDLGLPSSCNLSDVLCMQRCPSNSGNGIQRCLSEKDNGIQRCLLETGNGSNLEDIWFL